MGANGQTDFLVWVRLGVTDNALQRVYFMHDIPKQDIKNEQLLRLAIYQATNLDLSGSARKQWFKQAIARHKMRSKELVLAMENEVLQ